VAEIKKADQTVEQLRKSWESEPLWPEMTLGEFQHAAEIYTLLRQKGWTVIGFRTAEGPKVRFCDTSVSFECVGPNLYKVMVQAHTHIFGGKKSS
jgi:hypothetical protein